MTTGHAYTKLTGTEGIYLWVIILMSIEMIKVRESQFEEENLI